MADQQPTVSSAVEWRRPREEGFLKQLPSGKIARLRPISPDLLLYRGEVPDLLTGLVTKMVMGGADAQDLDAVVNPALSIAEAGDSVRFFNLVCQLAFVSPRIVENPQGDDEIAIEDVDLVDRGFVWRVCTLATDELRFFRVEPPVDVAPVPDGENVEPATE